VGLPLVVGLTFGRQCDGVGGAFHGKDARISRRKDFLRVAYPDEHHWILKGRNSKHWCGEVLAWLGKYLKW
jgi:hypothetical protein